MITRAAQIFPMCLFLFLGCATTRFTYEALQYRDIGQGTTIEIATIENKTGFSDPKKIRYNVSLDIPLVDAVRTALTKEMFAAGFKIGIADRQVSVKVQRFFGKSFWSDGGPPIFEFVISSKTTRSVIFARSYVSTAPSSKIWDDEGTIANIRSPILQFLADNEALQHLKAVEQ